MINPISFDIDKLIDAEAVIASFINDIAHRHNLPDDQRDAYADLCWDKLGSRPPILHTFVGAHRDDDRIMLVVRPHDRLTALLVNTLVEIERRARP